MNLPSVRAVIQRGIHLSGHITAAGDGGGSDRTAILARIRQNQCRVLIVDDDVVFRTSIVLRIKVRYGADVDFAAAGPGAIQKATMAAKPFDLIILDIRLQQLNGAETAKLDGVDVCDVLVQGGIKTPILFMSAYVDDDVRAKVDERKRKLHRKESQTLFTEIESILLHCRGGDA